MKRVRAWLLGCALTLPGTPVLADLQLQLQATGLDPQQTQATQALLDEALGKLPPIQAAAGPPRAGQLERQHAGRCLRPGIAGVHP